VLGDTIRSESRHRLLRDPGLRSERARRRSVVGVILAQRRGFAGARLARSAHRADDDHDERRSARLAAARLIHQGRRRLDDHLPAVRVRVVDRVRGRQRAGASSAGNCRCACTSLAVHCHRCQVAHHEPPAHD